MSTQQLKPSENKEATVFVLNPDNSETDFEVTLDKPKSSTYVTIDPFKPSDNVKENDKGNSFSGPTPFEKHERETLPNLAPLSDGSEGSVSSSGSDITPFEAGVKGVEKDHVGAMTIEIKKEDRGDESEDEGYFTPEEEDTESISKQAPPKPESPLFKRISTRPESPAGQRITAEENKAPETKTTEQTSSNQGFRDSFQYVAAIKQEFADDPHVYKEFLSIMRNFHTSLTTVSETVELVCKLFIGHTELILGFNSFLPKDAQIDPEELESLHTAEEHVDETEKEEPQVSRSLEVSPEIKEVKEEDTVEEKPLVEEEVVAEEKAIAVVAEEEAATEKKVVADAAEEEIVTEEKAIAEEETVVVDKVIVADKEIINKVEIDSKEAPVVEKEETTAKEAVVADEEIPDQKIIVDEEVIDEEETAADEVIVVEEESSVEDSKEVSEEEADEAVEEIKQEIAVLEAVKIVEVAEEIPEESTEQVVEADSSRSVLESAVSEEVEAIAEELLKEVAEESAERVLESINEEPVVAEAATKEFPVEVAEKPAERVPESISEETAVEELPEEVVEEVAEKVIESVNESLVETEIAAVSDDNCEVRILGFKNDGRAVEISLPSTAIGFSFIGTFVEDTPATVKKIEKKSLFHGIPIEGQTVLAFCCNGIEFENMNEQDLDQLLCDTDGLEGRSILVETPENGYTIKVSLPRTSIELFGSPSEVNISPTTVKTLGKDSQLSGIVQAGQTVLALNIGAIEYSNMTDLDFAELLEETDGKEGRSVVIASPGLPVEKSLRFERLPNFDVTKVEETPPREAVSASTPGVTVVHYLEDGESVQISVSDEEFEENMELFTESSLDEQLKTPNAGISIVHYFEDGESVQISVLDEEIEENAKELESDDEEVFGENKEHWTEPQLFEGTVEESSDRDFNIEEEEADESVTSKKSADETTENAMDVYNESVEAVIEDDSPSQYLMKVKSHFANEPEKYGAFLDTLMAYKEGLKKLDYDVLGKVEKLFDNDSTLVNDFNVFLPGSKDIEIDV